MTLNIELTALDKLYELLRSEEVAEIETDLTGKEGEVYPGTMVITRTVNGQFDVEVWKKNETAPIWDDPAFGLEDMHAVAQHVKETWGDDLEDIVDAWL